MTHHHFIWFWILGDLLSFPFFFIFEKEGIYSEFDVVRESAAITCIWAATQRQGEEWGRFKTKKREGFRSVLIEGCWHGEAVGLSKLKAGHLMWLTRGAYLAFFGFAYIFLVWANFLTWGHCAFIELIQVSCFKIILILLSFLLQPNTPFSRTFLTNTALPWKSD